MTPIASTDAHEEWLRRVSDYHSGGLAADERARVEAHLATCAECRDALTVYQRFYALARSPLALGEPSAAVAERSAVRALSPLRMRQVWGEQDAPPLWSGRARVGLAAGLVAALLIGSFLAVFSLRHSGPAAQPTPTPSGTLTPLPTTVTTPETSAPTDWTQVPLDGAGGVPSVTFSPTSPRIGYGCSVSANHVVSVSMTQDGGSSWTTVGTVGRIGTCLISVDPYNSQDVALVTPGQPFGVFRSFDGGRSWALDIVYSAQGSFQRWGWAGSRLLVATSTGTGASTKTHLFASTAATRATQLDSDGALGSLNLQQVSLLAGSAQGNLIYVVDGPAGGSAAQWRTLFSADGGSNWAETTFTNQGARVQPGAFSADGAAIAAIDGSLLSLSNDGGRTWEQPTAFPGEIDYRSLFVASGSTVVAISATFDQGDRNIYTITAGRSHTWAKTPVPAGARLVAVAMGLNGLPASFWIERAANSQRTSGVLLWRRADNSPPLVAPNGG